MLRPCHCVEESQVQYNHEITPSLALISRTFSIVEKNDKQQINKDKIPYIQLFL